MAESVEWISGNAADRSVEEQIDAAAGARIPDAETVARSVAHTLSVSFVVFALLGVITAELWASPTDQVAVWSAVADLGAGLIGDSGWVMPALLALTVGFYAVAIGENVLRTEPDSARRVRVVVGAFAQIVAALTLLWLVTALIGAVAKPALVPHLAGVLVIGTITCALGVMFGAFEFRSTSQLRGRALAIVAKEERRRDSIPSDWVGASPARGLVATIGGVTLLGVITFSIALPGAPWWGPIFLAAWIPLPVGMIVYWQAVSLWRDRPSKYWRVNMTLSSLFVFGLATLLIVFAWTNTSALLMITWFCQLALLAASRWCPRSAPAWVRFRTLHSAAITRARHQIERRVMSAQHRAERWPPTDSDTVR